MNRSEDFDDTIRQRSGWLIPVGVFAVTAVLSMLVLLYYLLPRPESFLKEAPSYTARNDAIPILVNGVKFSIPANYIVYKSARQGGARNLNDHISLTGKRVSRHMEFLACCAHKTTTYFRF